jgi:hypothetical protein
MFCVQSKKYVSADGKFIFRYPSDFPISYKTGEQMVNQYSFDDKYEEWVNFSRVFYPNAGGERLGSVIVTKDNTYNDVSQFASNKLSNYKVPPILEYMKIGGKDAVCFSLKQQPNSFSTAGYHCYVIDSNKLYSMSFDYNDFYHKQSLEYYSKARQLILSTFTFK